MIRRLAVVGATGDLAARYLLAGLVALRAEGHLGDDFELICAGRVEWDTETYRRWLADQLDLHATPWPPEARKAIVDAARYQRADITDAADVASLIAGSEPVAVYLALPPALFPSAVTSLHSAGLPAGSRVVVEKPFGEDLASAEELNRLLAELVPEQAVFRVDHFLAMTTVQNLLGSRLANRVLEPIWNSTHIAEVEIVWDETLALEGRAGYYDGVGALRDMLQNHLLQLLCLVAMEPPISLDEHDLRNRKVDVLRSVRPLSEDDVLRRTRRARYTAGRIGEREIPAYTDEEGVDPARRTETFAEIELELDSWRWSGTAFRLRSGKALGRDRMEVAIRFRSVPHLPFGHGWEAEPNLLRFGLEPESVNLHLTGTGSRTHALAPLTLTAQMEPPELPAYGRLLLDVLTGNPALSIRGDEAEEAWRIVEPVLAAWSAERVPLEEYPAGSDGPAEPKRSSRGYR
jgi:glucose-6-phosphate 1-dehydrogenase